MEQLKSILKLLVIEAEHVQKVPKTKMIFNDQNIVFRQNCSGGSGNQIKHAVVNLKKALIIST